MLEQTLVLQQQRDGVVAFCEFDMVRYECVHRVVARSTQIGHSAQLLSRKFSAAEIGAVRRPRPEVVPRNASDAIAELTRAIFYAFS